MKTTRTQHFEQLMKDFQRMSKAMMRDKQSHFSDLPFGQRAALMSISMHERLSIKKLATELQITSGAATQQVDALVKARLVRRAEDGNDRRLVHVTLSKLGQKRLKEIKKAKMKTFRSLFEDVGDDDLADFVRVVKLISQNITEKEEN